MQKHDCGAFTLVDVMKRYTLNFDKTADWRMIAFGLEGTMSNPQCTDGGGGCDSRESSDCFGRYRNFVERARHDFSSSGNGGSRSASLEDKPAAAACKVLDDMFRAN
ncbi:hypothetical protein [Paraburkholderia strydomiana]|uniref:hypothetical protein n=1 Tax=Paraburkholderia strydomiana TaxID=1245417 RepID=UPI00286262AB|nr:hypothetical protein [Paraburkholderia strydomiana]MDR7008921.1 hypothetical protein [Paraburkholderia strydomiana]